MRVPLISAVVAAAALFAFPAAAHGWSEDRDQGDANECPLPAQHHHASHAMHHARGHVAYHCQVAVVTPPVEEHVRIYRHVDTDEWRGDHERCDGDRCGDGNRDEGWREHEEHWRGADGDRGMSEHDGRGYVDGGTYYQRQGPNMTYERRGYVDGGVHHEDEDRRGWDDHQYAYRSDGMHHEDEGRRGWDDREYAYRDGGMQWEAGDARARVYHEQRERVWSSGEHWIDHCGCASSRPSATDAYGLLVWSGKVVPEGYPDEPTWYVHP